MKRLFTFGCSYTSYSWPTWADIVARDTGLESYNYGHAGVGNVAIMHNIVKADLEHRFTSDDIILVLWSHWHREDRWRNGNWVGVGSVFNNEEYDKKFIKKYWSYQNDIVKNSTAIISVNKMYSDILGFQGHMSYPGTTESDLEVFSVNNEDVELSKFYSDEIPKDNVFDNEEVYDFDGHPSVLTHLHYVINNVYPSMGLTIKPETVEFYKHMDNELHAVNNSKLSYDKKMKKVEQTVKQIEENYEKN